MTDRGPKKSALSGMENQPKNPNTTSSDQINYGIQAAKRGITNISDADRRVWELVSDVPKLNLLKAYGCAIANVIFSGLGTIVSSFLGDEPGVNKTQLVVGILQMLTAVYLIGWMLSIYWAYKLVMKASNNRSVEQQRLVPNGTAQSQNVMNPYAV